MQLRPRAGPANHAVPPKGADRRGGEGAAPRNAHGRTRRRADNDKTAFFLNRNNYEGPLPEGVAQKFTIESLKEAEKTAEAKQKPLVKPKLKTQETKTNTDKHRKTKKLNETRKTI